MKFGLSDTVISELQAVFRRHANIEKVLIFGSRSKGNYHEGSDIDFVVFFVLLSYFMIKKAIATPKKLLR